jgi:hypothetical protein
LPRRGRNAGGASSGDSDTRDAGAGSRRGKWVRVKVGAVLRG